MSILSFAALRIVSQQTIKYFVDADLENRDRSVSHPYKNVGTRVDYAEIIGVVRMSNDQLLTLKVHTL